MESETCQCGHPLESGLCTGCDESPDLCECEGRDPPEPPIEPYDPPLEWYDPNAPLECVKCGSKTGPPHPMNADHPGWMCPACYHANSVSLLAFPAAPPEQTYQGKIYPTNEVGGIDIFTTEPTKPCPRCGTDCHADWIDNGFGPYAVQAGPYHCGGCGWTEEGSNHA